MPSSKNIVNHSTTLMTHGLLYLRHFYFYLSCSGYFKIQKYENPTAVNSTFQDVVKEAYL